MGVDRVSYSNQVRTASEVKFFAPINRADFSNPSNEYCTVNTVRNTHIVDRRVYVNERILAGVDLQNRLFTEGLVFYGHAFSHVVDVNGRVDYSNLILPSDVESVFSIIARTVFESRSF